MGPTAKRTFDTSSGRDPLPVVLGVSNFIPGFQQAIVGMSGWQAPRTSAKSGVWLFRRARVIPPNASLVFEIELITLVQ
jgi:FKBP-type peptidyl-prolyl cis-trans isomerase